MERPSTALNFALVVLVSLLAPVPENAQGSPDAFELRPSVG
jgi:hypothetical protein